VAITTGIVRDFFMTATGIRTLDLVISQSGRSAITNSIDYFMDTRRRLMIYKVSIPISLKNIRQLMLWRIRNSTLNHDILFFIHLTPVSAVQPKRTTNSRRGFHLLEQVQRPPASFA
jgi:hypothetical protein